MKIHDFEIGDLIVTSDYPTAVMYLVVGFNLYAFDRVYCDDVVTGRTYALGSEKVISKLIRKGEWKYYPVSKETK